jgi:hypothetical protein
LEQECKVAVNFFKPGCLVFIVKTREMIRRGVWQEGLVFGDKESISRFFSCFVFP